MVRPRSVPCRPVALLVGLALVIGGLGFTDGGLLSAQGGAETPRVGEVLPDPELVHPDVATQVAVDFSGLGPTATKYVEARLDENDATRRGVVAEATLGSLTVSAEILAVRIAEARSLEGTTAALAADAERELSGFAIHAFVEGEEGNLGELELRGSASPEPRLNQEVGGLLWTAMKLADARHTDALDALRSLEAAQQHLDARIVAVESDRLSADADLADARERAQRYRSGFETAVMRAPVVGLDFPLVVLDAYFRAERGLAERQPECGLRWYQLAGIGQVESGHGTFGGSSVGPDGTTSRRILGPVLDGTKFRAIADSDGGALDGDTTWDRAVGPMQFIPSSWRIFGHDGNGDGVVDPHNIYDAALAAGDHLCRRHSGLADPGRFRQALFGYNRSAAYGITVMGLASRYEEAVDLVPSPSEEDDAPWSAPGAGVSGVS